MQKNVQLLVRWRQRLVLSVLAFTIVAGSSLPAVAHAQAANTRQMLFSKASSEFGVPASVLLAIGYTETRWQSPGGEQSVDGGYGIMDLRGAIDQSHTREHGRGTDQPRKQSASSQEQTADTAANLLHVSVKAIQHDEAQNIRGAAAVLASYAKDLNGGTLPKDAADWYGAVARYAGDLRTPGAERFADSVFGVIAQGASLTTVDGQRMTLAPSKGIVPNKKDVTTVQTMMAPQAAAATPECPNTLNCRFIPAGYAPNSADPADYGNFDYANRPNDMQIKYIVIHDTEGSYDSAINHFQDTTSYVSSQYVIRSNDGAITQMVKNKDVAWTAGDWYVNMHSINIEHEGFAAQGSTWYTEEMYRSSATLVRWLAQKYDIPLDREHIIGHNNVPTNNPATMPGQHWDPGPYWDWNHYMALLNGVSDQEQRRRDSRTDEGSQKTVTINPDFKANKQLFSDCQSGTCVDLPKQASSTVFVRTQPSANAPLLSDQYVHPDGAAGTNRDDDWGDQTSYGQQFAYAGKQGDWLALWYGGKKGWIYNPATNPVAAITEGHTVTPRVGKATIPVYGVAYPEASAYPSDGTVPVQPLRQLYAMPTGQAYATTGEIVPTDYFYDWTYDYSVPHDHMVVVGNQRFFQVQYNHRIGYVLASDVRYQP